MEMHEFQGKTAEEAIENACRTLNIERELMEIQVLEPGSTGIFGLVGGKKAKIKVTIPEKKPGPEKKADDDTVELEPHSVTDTDRSVTPSAGDNGTAVAKEALENILALIPSEETTVKASKSDGIISLEITGDKSGLLIGRKGRTLDALQYIVNKIVNKTLEKRTQVVIDSESYRQKRLEFLTQMALEMGAKAKKIQKPVATNLLYPQDRRIVHIALQNDDGLTTKSKGDGLFKKVIIIPKG